MAMAHPRSPSETATGETTPSSTRGRVVEAVVPAVEERVEVGRRIEETDRVRVTTRTETREVHLEEVAEVEHVEVERVPIDRLVDTVPMMRVGRDEVVIPVLEEVVVTEKRLLLKEEIHLRKRRVEEPRSLDVPARTQRVVVEHVGPKPEDRQREHREEHSAAGRAQDRESGRRKR